jgi:GNAT superfamily N-acetyltransferase
MVALVALQPVIRLMGESDPETMSAAFTVLGWHKPPALYQRYLAEQEEGRRLAFLAEWRGGFAGYVTLLWVSDYRPFAERQIPEISDLNVLPPHRGHGIGNALLDRAESAASARSKVVGLGVGLYSDYGAAQRIYVRRGYLPDGRGIMYRNQPVEPGATIRIDDDAALMLTRPVGLRSPRGAHRVRAMGNALHAVARALIGPPTIRAEPGDLRSMRSLSGASARQKIFGDRRR